MDSIASYVVCLVIIVGTPIIGFFVVSLWDRLRIASNASNVAKNSREQAEALLGPMFEEVEEFFGRPLAQSLVSLYRDTQVVSRCDFEVEFEDGRVCYISHFHPCNLATIHAISESYPTCIGLLAIASDGGDLEYVVDPVQQNPPVLQFDVEANSFEQVAKTLSEFVEALETSGRSLR